MPCYKPLTAYYSPGGSITFNRSTAFWPNQPFQIPCSRCLGCRLEHAKEWALRCTHEASLYDKGLNNSFITLTYRPADLPEFGNLRRVDFQKFIKRLRTKSGQKIRYFMCGEYGETNYRPHYHALLFGYQFKDKKLVNIRNGNRVYTSEELEKTWRYGDCEIGSVTFNSAGYVARYIVKKQQGDAQELFNRYVIIDEHGEMTSRHNEYTNMSLKPGIGERWYDKNYSDCFPHDYCVLPDGRQTPVPSYYRNILRKNDPALWEKLRVTRIAKAKDNPNNTPERLAVREIVKQKQTQELNTRDSI